MRAPIMLMAAALLTASTPAIAQTGGTDEVEVLDERNDEDDGNSKLGLLGLLGLAGLLGLKRREPDIHVDARRDKRP